MRTLTEHKINPANDLLEISVIDRPGAGGANHRYEVSGFDLKTNASYDSLGVSIPATTVIIFQNGPIAEAGVNGITQEVLLAIVADRLRSFQSGPYACEPNARALECVVQAMNILHARTIERMHRGVEGTHQK